MSKLEHFITKDGSSSFYHPQLDETYHSRHGAIQESQHVFIKSGLEYYLQKQTKSSISVFELGFGTGLNALLAALWSNEHDLNIYYESIEKTVLSLDQSQKCNYSEQISNQTVQDVFTQIHKCNWNQEQAILPTFKIKKIEGAVGDYAPKKSFDLVFFDAFGPRVQPELWEVDNLQKMYDILDNQGVFVTYCAKGSVRRTLINIGFTVERIPGPPGKREMLRAIK